MDSETAANLTPTSAPPPTAEKTVPEQGGNRPPEPQDLNAEQRRALIFIVVAVILLMAALIVSIIYLMNAPLGEVARIRDIFIIFLAIQSLLTGLALVILIVQLARLINLLQNEVKPILDSTNETVSNLRGTTVFLSDNLVEPVIKLNEYMAGITRLLFALGLTKRTTNKE